MDFGDAFFLDCYARLLYPACHLAVRRISDLLAAVNDEASWRAFFARCAALLRRREGEDVVIDSTGLPNSIRFPLTAISDHNGQISEAVRLIYAVQRGTNLPLYLPIRVRRWSRSSTCARRHQHAAATGA